MRQVGCESKVSISIFCQLKAEKYDSDSATSSRITNLGLISAFFCKTVWLPASTFMHKIPLQDDSNLQNCQIQQPKCTSRLKPCANISPVPTNCSGVIPQLQIHGDGKLPVTVTSTSALHFPEQLPKAPSYSMRSPTLINRGEERLPSSAATAKGVLPKAGSTQQTFKDVGIDISPHHL